MSENIRVTSIVGRFLEHGRVYYFRNGGDDELYLGSADLMPRNLNWRVEIVFPVEDAEHRDWLRDDLLGLYQRDSVNAWRMRSDGSYERVAPASGEAVVDTHSCFLHNGVAIPQSDPALAQLDSAQDGGAVG